MRGNADNTVNVAGRMAAYVVACSIAGVASVFAMGGSAYAAVGEVPDPDPIVEELPTSAIPTLADFDSITIDAPAKEAPAEGAGADGVQTDGTGDADDAGEGDGLPDAVLEQYVDPKSMAMAASGGAPVSIQDDVRTALAGNGELHLTQDSCLDETVVIGNGKHLKIYLDGHDLTLSDGFTGSSVFELQATSVGMGDSSTYVEIIGYAGSNNSLRASCMRSGVETLIYLVHSTSTMPAFGLLKLSDCTIVCRSLVEAQSQGTGKNLSVDAIRAVINMSDTMHIGSNCTVNLTDTTVTRDPSLAGAPASAATVSMPVFNIVTGTAELSINGSSLIQNKGKGPVFEMGKQAQLILGKSKNAAGVALENDVVIESTDDSIVHFLSTDASVTFDGAVLKACALGNFAAGAIPEFAGTAGNAVSFVSGHFEDDSVKGFLETGRFCAIDATGEYVVCTQADLACDCVGTINGIYYLDAARFNAANKTGKVVVEYVFVQFKNDEIVIEFDYNGRHLDGLHCAPGTTIKHAAPGFELPVLEDLTSDTAANKVFKGWWTINGQKESETVNGVTSPKWGDEVTLATNVGTSKSVTFFARYDVEMHELTFHYGLDANDGYAFSKSNMVANNSSAKSMRDRWLQGGQINNNDLKHPKGCNFLGWSYTPGGPVITNFDAVKLTDSNVNYEFYAVYEFIMASVRFEYGVGQTGDPNKNNTVQVRVRSGRLASSQIPSAATVNVKGYTFKGWRAGNAKADDALITDLTTYDITGNTTFYAVYEKKEIDPNAPEEPEEPLVPEDPSGQGESGNAGANGTTGDDGSFASAMPIAPSVRTGSLYGASLSSAAGAPSEEAGAHGGADAKASAAAAARKLGEKSESAAKVKMDNAFDGRITVGEAPSAPMVATVAVAGIASVAAGLLLATYFGGLRGSGSGVISRLRKLTGSK